MKASVRCEALDLKGLARAERHGKREDWISQQRRIRKVDPLTLGGATDAEGLNLADLYADHIEGAKMNRAARKTVLHFIIHYPDEMLNDDGPVPGFAAMTRPEREKALLQQAVDFVNRTHGGDAVFAARLDRDEAGLTNIDVFATPKYLKPSKSARREPSLWVSSTRFGEALARKHQEHIRGRLTEAEVKTDRDGNEIPLTSPRAVGMALQEEFHEFFAAVNGVALEERTLKESRSKDRIEVEEWRLRRMEAEAAEALRQRDEARAAQEVANTVAAEAQAAAEAALAAQADAEARTEATRQERDAARQEAAAARTEAEDARQDAKAAQAAQADAEARERAARDHAKAIAGAGLALVAEMAEETVHYDDKGVVRVRDAKAIKPGMPELAPLLRAAAVAQRDRDEKRAFIARQVKNLAEAWQAIRTAIPVVRYLTQKKDALAEEMKAARLGRREIVRVSPIVRSSLKHAHEEAAKIGVVLPPEDPVEKPEATDDGLGL